MYIMLHIFLTASLMSTGLNTVDVFHKEMPPSQQTLEMVNTVLSEFADEYEIAYHLITDTASSGIIQQYNLPGTHFPFAITVNEKYSATINEETIFFVHFPLFMHGIGRHEGNWSMDHLQQVLANTSLLIDENIPPVLDESEETTECPEEE
ncbi:MAG: hypothetical protein KAH31_01670 [Candidatus Sabulitectum sp.]|nr:hypothetical protein [Candidatus Sabulitectum sp.]